MVSVVRSAWKTLSGVSGGLVKLLGYRDLLWQMIRTDLRGRYLGSLLGLSWTVVHPLVMIGIYILVFSRLMGARLAGHTDAPYAFGIYLCAALLPWNLFAEVMARSTNVFLEHANLVKKMAFPNLLLHLYVAGTAAVHAAIVMGIFLLFLLAVGQLPPAAALAAWILLTVLQLILAMGLGLMASTLNVFFRDVGQIITVLLQVWFWLTPIVYVADILPSPARRVLRFNLLAWIAQGQQQAILNHGLPGPGLTAILALLAPAVLAAGLACYGALRHRIPDEL
ncbi:MAG: ABC transporter permease [Acidobacteria bacterium]|nr:ABC transporter permease [Acidobacteriota bacterium]